MKIFFKNKTWIVMQGMFFIFGIFSAISVKNYTGIEPGSLAMIFHFLSDTTELTIPIFLILTSDLALNTEILEGTFMTHILTGKSQSGWFARRFFTFILFAVIQFFLAGLLLGAGDILVSGHIGLEGLKEISHFPSQLTTVWIASGIVMNLLKSLSFVSLAIFMSTLFPGKLFIGTSVSMGMIFATGGILNFFKSSILSMSKPLLNIVKAMIMANLSQSWWFAISTILGFWLLSYLSLKVKKIKITNQGV